MRKPLVPAVGSIAGHGPTDRVMGSSLGPAPIINVGVHPLDARSHPIELGQVVLSAERPTFAAGAVVGYQDEDRVVENTVLLQVPDQPAQLVVGMREKAGGDFHLALEQRLLQLVMIVPRAEAGVWRRQNRALRHHAHLLLTFERLCANDIPSRAERAAVWFPPLAPDVVRDV